MTWVQTEDFSPSQMGVQRTRMSAAMTLSKIGGQSSLSHPCSVMSGHTPAAMSWSRARIISVLTPFASRMSIETSASPAVLDTSGERFSVQLMKRALKSA